MSSEIIEGNKAIANELIFTTASGEVIPLGNVDYIGQLVKPWSWGYHIHLKSGTAIFVGTSYEYGKWKDDRDKLVKKLEAYINNQSKQG